MADKRMLSNLIVGGDDFSELPLSAQALYFHLIMRADDDGFINCPRNIQRSISAKDDDMTALIDNGLIYFFKSGIVCIRHWHVHNNIRKDQFKETVYRDERALVHKTGSGEYVLIEEAQEEEKIEEIEAEISPENDAENSPYRTCTEPVQNVLNPCTEPVQNVLNPCTEPVQNLRTNKGGIIREIKLDLIREGKGGMEGKPPDTIAKLFNDTCKSLPSVTLPLSKKRTEKVQSLKQRHSDQDLEKAFLKAEQSDFLKGNNPRKWRMTFDWLIKDDNLQKVLEGSYDNPSGTKKTGKGRYDFEQIQKQALENLMNLQTDSVQEDTQ